MRIIPAVLVAAFRPWEFVFAVSEKQHHAGERDAERTTSYEHYQNQLPANPDIPTRMRHQQPMYIRGPTQQNVPCSKTPAQVQVQEQQLL